MSRQMSHVHWRKKRLTPLSEIFEILGTKCLIDTCLTLFHQSSLSFVSWDYSISQIRGFKLEKIERSAKVCLEIGTFVRK